uniref:Uncharacterized protein n=1 Tax=Sipha flava TaxID=143950 RepID=A0A2S2R2F4_9HEMI
MWFIITIIIITRTIIIIYYIIPHNRKQEGARASAQDGSGCMLINHKAIHGITVGYTLLVKQLHPFIVSRYCYRCNRPSLAEIVNIEPPPTKSNRVFCPST